MSHASKHKAIRTSQGHPAPLQFRMTNPRQHKKVQGVEFFSIHRVQYLAGVRMSPRCRSQCPRICPCMCSSKQGPWQPDDEQCRKSLICNKQSTRKRKGRRLNIHRAHPVSQACRPGKIRISQGHLAPLQLNMTNPRQHKKVQGVDFSSIRRVQYFVGVRMSPRCRNILKTYPILE